MEPAPHETHLGKGSTEIASRCRVGLAYCAGVWSVSAQASGERSTTIAELAAPVAAVPGPIDGEAMFGGDARVPEGAVVVSAAPALADARATSTRAQWLVHFWISYLRDRASNTLHLRKFSSYRIRTDPFATRSDADHPPPRQRKRPPHGDPYATASDGVCLTQRRRGRSPADSRRLPRAWASARRRGRRTRLRPAAQRRIEQRSVAWLLAAPPASRWP